LISSLFRLSERQKAFQFTDLSNIAQCKQVSGLIHRSIAGSELFKRVQQSSSELFIAIIKDRRVKVAISQCVIDDRAQRISIVASEQWHIVIFVDKEVHRNARQIIADRKFVQYVEDVILERGTVGVSDRFIAAIADNKGDVIGVRALAIHSGRRCAWNASRWVGYPGFCRRPRVWRFSGNLCWRAARCNCLRTRRR